MKKKNLSVLSNWVSSYSSLQKKGITFAFKDYTIALSWFYYFCSEKLLYFNDFNLSRKRFIPTLTNIFPLKRPKKNSTKNSKKFEKIKSNSIAIMEWFLEKLKANYFLEAYPNKKTLMLKCDTQWEIFNLKWEKEKK